MKKIILLGMALTLLALACGEEEGVTEPNPHYRLVPTSPCAVLVNVETAFNRRDINLLKAMLSPNFVFYFDPDDVGQTPPGGSYIIPESWSYTEFWQSVKKMFEFAYAISLTIPTGSVGTPDPNATTYKVENISIRILVMIDDLNGYLADTGYCNFAFERYDGPGGGKLWRLAKWWDNTRVSSDEAPGVEPASLGRILALFK